jgi:hypothetical protein
MQRADWHRPDWATLANGEFCAQIGIEFQLHFSRMQMSNINFRLCFSVAFNNFLMDIEPVCVCNALRKQIYAFGLDKYIFFA